jgi:trehalose/maltose hydrolase-like predicted phosphorylase
VARLFTALASYDPADDRFHITGVMGPDEYHDGYPDAPGQGLRDSAYTNLLAAWVCERADEALTVLQGHHCVGLMERLKVEEAERTMWRRLSWRLAVPFHGEGVISQFDGYERLAELDWVRYRRSYGNIGRLDLILEAEGDTTNRYQLAKQADVLMLLYVLGADELRGMLDRLGYPLSAETLPRVVDYYLARTAHGSTLSRVVHAAVLAEIDRARSWDIFRDALVADLDDTQGGSTGEGIHLDAMAGTINIVIRSFAGLRVERGQIRFHPQLPEQLARLRFQVHCQGHVIDVTLDQTQLELFLHPCAAGPLNISVKGASATMTAGERRQFRLFDPPPAAGNMPTLP